MRRRVELWIDLVEQFLLEHVLLCVFMECADRWDISYLSFVLWKGCMWRHCSFLNKCRSCRSRKSNIGKLATSNKHQSCSSGVEIIAEGGYNGVSSTCY